MITTFSASLGIFIVKVSPGLADDGVSVIQFNVDSDFNPKGSRDALFGLITSGIAIAISN